MNDDQRMHLQSILCEHCRFYDLDNTVCRRYPPTMICINGELKKVWTPMARHSWCGEFKRAKWVDELFDEED